MLLKDYDTEKNSHIHELLSHRRDYGNLFILSEPYENCLQTSLTISVSYRHVPFR